MGWWNDYGPGAAEAEFDHYMSKYPAHRDPFDGHYVTGTRKCSRCSTFKTKKDFTIEQANKSRCRAHLQAVREIGAESAGDKTHARRPSSVTTMPKMTTRRTRPSCYFLTLRRSSRVLTPTAITRSRRQATRKQRCGS